MNNREAWEYFTSKKSERDAAVTFISEFNLDENEVNSIRYKFNSLKSSREKSTKYKIFLFGITCYFIH